MSSFLFYDLETFGLDSSFDRISQFAAIRTDAELNEIGEPVDLLVQPPMDALPSPGASLVTRTTPWANMERGIKESEAMRRIHALMAEPGTCSLGHNTYRFDDAFMRNGFYRNFLPVYDREWRNGNSRFDTLNLLRHSRS